MDDIDFLKDDALIHSDLEYGYLDAKATYEEGGSISRVRELVRVNGVEGYYDFGWYLYLITHSDL